MSDDRQPMCRCINTECLQGHSMCFSAQWYCSEHCECLNCWNTQDNEDEVEEQTEMSGAFSFETSKTAGAQDTVQMHASSSDAALQRSRVKGCKCRKTRCNKWVCECLKSKVGCTSKCKCEGCVNCFGIKGRQGGTGGISNITDEAMQTEYSTSSNTEPEQVDTSSMTGESMQMEHPTQCRDTGDSDPNKQPRIWLIAAFTA